MATTVVNIRDSQLYDVFIGRPSIFSNPFRIGKDGTRAEVVYEHLIYFHRLLISDPIFKRAVLSLKGKRLGCFCHCWNGIGENPMYCHGDNIASYLNTLPEGKHG